MQADLMYSYGTVQGSGELLMSKYRLTSSIVAAGLVAFATCSAQANVLTRDVPPGTAYWINSSDVLGTRLNGDTLKVGNPLAPCFTGRRVGAGTYKGGGYDQGGGYTRQTVKVNVAGERLTIRINGGASSYGKSTKAKVSSRFGGTNPSNWFSDCGLK